MPRADAEPTLALLRARGLIDQAHAALVDRQGRRPVNLLGPTFRIGDVVLDSVTGEIGTITHVTRQPQIAAEG